MRTPTPPRWPTAAATTIALAALAAAGCSSPSPERGTDSAASPPAVAAEAPAAAPAAWYSRARTLDLTGDGRPDSVRLEARGTRPDSLDVVLTLVVDGAERHREEWGSSYELALVDSAARVGAGAGEIVRAKLDTVLASVVVRPLGAPGARLMAEDSAALAGLAPRPAELILFAYGYETTTRLVWDAARERFVRLWSCC